MIKLITQDVDLKRVVDAMCRSDKNYNNFYVEQELQPTDINIEVQDIGVLNIAKDLHLIPHLALVNIMHRFVAYCDEDGPPIIDRKRKNPDYEIIKLTYWIGPDNKKIPVYQWELLVDSYEKNHCMCWNKTTSILEPYHQDYEEYQGNYGNVMQFWYRRAAIVLWRESDQEEMDQLINMKYAHFRA